MKNKPVTLEEALAALKRIYPHAYHEAKALGELDDEEHAAQKAFEAVDEAADVLERAEKQGLL